MASSSEQPIISDVIASTTPSSVVNRQAHKTGVVPQDVELDDFSSPRNRNSLETDDLDPTEYPVPTEEELTTLRKVHGSISWVAWLLCIIELAERASYYGTTSIFSNFIQFPLPDGGNGAGAPQKGTQDTAGALNKGLQFASAFVLLFTFLAYAMPILGAWLADAKIGRYPAITLGVLIAGLAHIIQVIGAIPSVLQAGNGTAPFIIGLFLLAIGAGIFKPSILPLILDQYRIQRPYTKVLKSGEKVIVDPELTISRISMLYYAFVNMGAFLPISTVYIEKYVGYWLAFLVPTVVYLLLPLLLAFTYKRTYRRKVDGSELTNFFRVLRMAIARSKGKMWGDQFWENARPSIMPVGMRVRANVTWDDQYVKDVRRVVSACGMFLYFPIYYFKGGIGSVLYSQASTLTTNGTPNDLLGNFAALVIIVAVPILTYIVYPTLAHFHIRFGRISRITFGFLLAVASNISGAVLQYYIYKTSPCGYYATGCETGTGVSHYSVWLQMPTVVLSAVSELFCQVTAYEIAYARAPKHLKSLVMALFLFMGALSAALNQILTPWIADPYLIWMWVAPAVALFLQTVVFHWRYRWMDGDEFMTKEVMLTGETSDGEGARFPDEASVGYVLTCRSNSDKGGEGRK
ncbi:POT family protein [Pseudovirgaria hyperparasitica]|uniref:POT family protein n=1 Tax=Pseudovirgaria hyperparasitica TaxID=470096 RepID=A0A6A6WGQ9_9PEZI|nr:POT family protein [Pseudovirgaria hyperparasitica]KAF2760341.1 POT family protein [Pseudovirgaria hyperparasitica]